LHDRTVTGSLPDDLPLLHLDAVLMEQVFVNLLENVIRHTPPGTPVEFAARTTGGRVEIEVADHGPGIPPGREEAIFARFQRATDRTDGGVGLGLAICRAAVEAHGGRISASNRPEGGALFRISLPAGDSPAPGPG